MRAAGVKRRIVTFALVAGAATLAVSPGTASAATSGPTCSSTIGIVTHGQHIVRDYVVGVDHDAPTTWPPSGGVVGAAVSAAGGAAVPGGPGPGAHFPIVAPGASFCTGSRSPGLHL